jgi:hypothetical protein
MPVLRAVFDTNVYRKLTPERASLLRALERAQSVVALAAYYPTLELGARLADSTHHDYVIIRRAFGAMWQHTHLYDGFRLIVPMFNDWDTQLTMGLFRRRIVTRDREMDVLAYCLGRAGRDPSEALTPDLSEAFAAMAEQVTEREASFAAQMRAIVAALDPAAAGWLPHALDSDARRSTLSHLRSDDVMTMLARSRATASAELAGTTMSEEDVSAAARSILTAFPTALRFFRDLLIGMVESGINFSKPQHANSIWDVNLAAVVSPSSSSGGVPTVLVTDERKFHTAAAATPHSAFCLTLSRYEALASRRELWEYGESLPRASV